MARTQLILDRYKPLGTAGAGGFGTVCIAWDQRIQRKVAIKTIQLSEIDAWRATLPGADAVANAAQLREERAADEWRGVQPWNEYLAEQNIRWPGEVVEPPHAPRELGPDDIDEPVTALAHLPGLDEARTAAQLQDPRIVGVFDFEVRDQVAYLIMEFVEGITLTKLLVRYENYLTLDVVAAVFHAVAGALCVAHKAGVLHLDIKPDNILINADGQVKVTDFGLATLADASGTGLAGGGTIGYMPLEQMRREPLDVRTDEWALASMTYEMLTGDNPFRVDSLEHAESAIEDAELIVPSLCWDNIDEQIDDVIFYALDPDKDKRYASVADFAEEVEKFLGDADAGQRQLAALVRDALGIVAEEPEYEEEDEFDEYEEPVKRRGVLQSVRDRLADNPQTKTRLFRFLGRAAVAATTGYLGFFAMQGVYQLAPLFGRGAVFTVALACAIIVAVVGAAVPHVGVLVACVLTGFSFIVAGQTVLGAVSIAVGLAWCIALSQLDHRETHPVLLGVGAALCIAALIAALVFAHPPQEFIVPSIFVMATTLANTFFLFADRSR